MVEWIDNKPETKSFVCAACESAFDEYPGATCPVCGEPLDEAEPDQQAEHGAKRAALWGAWR